MLKYFKSKLQIIFGIISAIIAFIFLSKVKNYISGKDKLKYKLRDLKYKLNIQESSEDSKELSEKISETKMKIDDIKSKISILEEYEINNDSVPPEELEDFFKDLDL